MKKLVCAILSAVLAISMVSCTFTSPATVLTVNGESVSAGIYLIFQYSAFSSAANKVEDSKKKVLSQKVEDIDAAEWIHNETLTAINQYVYVEKTFEEQGLSFTDEEIATAKGTAEEIYLANEKMFKKNGIGKDTYNDFYTNSRKLIKLREEFNAKDENKVTDDAAKKYMTDEFTHIYSVYFPIYTPEYKAITDDQRKQIEEIAKKLHKEVEGGKALTKELITTYLGDAFKITGHEMDDTTVSQFFSSDYIAEKSNNYFSQELKDAMLASKKGDVVMNTDNGSILVWGHVDTFTSDEEFEENKAEIVNGVLTEKFYKMIEEVTAQYTVDIDKSAQNTYSVKKVVLE